MICCSSTCPPTPRRTPANTWLRPAPCRDPVGQLALVGQNEIIGKAQVSIIHANPTRRIVVGQLRERAEMRCNLAAPEYRDLLGKPDLVNLRLRAEHLGIGQRP